MLGIPSAEMDPLLKGLGEKQQSFRRTIVSLAAELKDARTRLASQQQSLASETQARQELEMQAKSMEQQILRLQHDLECSNLQLQLSTAAIDQYVKELDDLRSQLSDTKATGDTNAALAQSAQRQYLALLNGIDEKDSELEENEDRVKCLQVQLALLRKDLEERENSQKQLINDVFVSEQMIIQDAFKASPVKNFELGNNLKEVSPKSLEKINKHLAAKDEEIALLREEIRIMSAHWKLIYRDMESRLEKHRRSDQKLRKMIIKLEYCLQEAHSQIRKLQRMGEKKDNALKELMEQMIIHQQGRLDGNYKQSFWESSGFKILISISLFILVVFSKR